MSLAPTDFDDWGPLRHEGFPVQHFAEGYRSTRARLLALGYRLDTHGVHMQTAYELGLFPAEISEGWSVHAGCEGEDPIFCGFFADEATALAFAKAKDADGEPMVFDASVDRAIVVGGTIYTSNDFEIDSHHKLRLRVAQLVVSGGAP